MTITFIYKCRRCGMIDYNPRMGSPNESAAKAMSLLVGATMNLKSNDSHTPTMLSVHSCGEEAFGISDLIGCQPYITPE